MRKFFITALFGLVALTALGQKIKRVTESVEDCMDHMSLYGYKVFAYDISSLRDSVSSATIVIREYNQQGMIGEKKLYGFRTRSTTSGLSKTLSIGFSPVTSDSVETITLRTANNDYCLWNLTLKPIPNAPQSFYLYKKVPYQPEPFQRDTFIPLVFYGSFWWDEAINNWCFCEEEELGDEKAKTSNPFRDSPHYYIIGAIFHQL